MPWLQQKGKISKKYHVKYEGGIVKDCWLQSGGQKHDTKLLTVQKRKWKHAHEKEASKFLFEIANELVVLIQYLGLKNQATLKLGKRHTKKNQKKKNY